MYMKQNNNEIQRSIKKDMKNKNKHYPDSLPNLRISYAVLVIEFKEIKQNKTTAGLKKSRGD